MNAWPHMPEVQDQPAKSTRPATAGAPRGAGDAPDPLARLKKMSTTAGIGHQEYVAVNPVAVAALILGLASLLVFLHDVLLLIPLAGVVCAIIAWRQIRNSSGTQTGRLMAFAGLVLSLCLGGGRLLWKVVGGWTNSADKAEIRRLIDNLGDHLSREQYSAAYGLFTDRFRERVSEQRFTQAYKELNAHPVGGGIKGMEWNGLVEFEDNRQSDIRLAYTMASLSFRDVDESGRQSVVLLKEGDRWLIDDLPAMFPREKKAGGGGGGIDPSGPGPGAAPPQ